jgi:Zn-dependent protease with chaperone function
MTLRDLERHPLFRRAYRLRNLYVLAALAGSLLLLWLLACLRIHAGSGGLVELLGYSISFEPFSWGTLARVGVFLALQLGFTHFAFRRALRQRKHMIKLYPKDYSKGRLFGSLTGPEIVEMVLEQARLLGVGKIHFIGVARQPDPNAYTAHVLGLGNVVVLHANLLEVLPPEGVRAVIAHEVGHIRRKDSLFYQVVNLPRSFAWVITALIFARIAAGILDADGIGQFLGRALFLVGAGYLTLTAFSWLERLANRASQQTELMVDAYAALNCGWENHLNALLLIGERAEALGAFAEELHKVSGRVDSELSEESLLRVLGRLPLKTRTAELARAAAPEVYIVDCLQQLKRKLLVPLTDEQINDLAARAAEALRTRNPRARKERDEDLTDEERAEREKEALLVDWRAFDQDRSGTLDAAELAALVTDLRKDPRRMVFRTFLEPDAEWQDHPTTRQRVLFLHDVFSGLSALAGQRA